MQNEQWKSIPSYPNYEVSNMGNVRNSKLNKPKEYYADNAGYPQVTLSHKGKSRPWRIHKLVAALFVPNLNSYPQINHIDGNKQNNRADNLEWMNPKENTSHAYTMKLREKIWTRNRKPA